MFLNTVSKKHNKKIKERNKKKMKDTRKNTKDTKKRKNWNNLKQSSVIEKIFAKKKRQKHIHTERENSEKKRNMETYGNDNKKWKSKK